MDNTLEELEAKRSQLVNNICKLQDEKAVIDRQIGEIKVQHINSEHKAKLYLALRDYKDAKELCGEYEGKALIWKDKSFEYKTNLIKTINTIAYDLRIQAWDVELYMEKELGYKKYE